MVTIAGRYPNLQRCFANLFTSHFVEGSMSDYIGMPTNMGIKTTQQIQTDSTATSKRHDHEVVISLKGVRYTRDIA